MATSDPPTILEVLLWAAFEKDRLELAEAQKDASTYQQELPMQRGELIESNSFRNTNKFRDGLRVFNTEIIKQKLGFFCRTFFIS